MAELYGAGAAMGFTPQQVEAMSMWQFRAAVAGVVRANSPDKGPQLSAAEKDELFDWLEGGPIGPRALTTMVYGWDDGPVPLRRVSFKVES